MAEFITADYTEAAFYNAFANCDLDAMSIVWSNDEVVCIHPGSVALVGREAVMRSWTHILTNAQLPELQYKVLSRISRNDLAVHVVEEYIASAGDPVATTLVLATNVYYRSDDAGWLLLEHHASVTRVKHEQHTLQ